MIKNNRKHSFKEFIELETVKWRMLDFYDGYLCLETIAKKTGSNLEDCKKFLDNDNDFIKNERGNYKYIGGNII